jgi:hypothetical protein
MYCNNFRPDLIDYDALHPENHQGNLNNAFCVARQELDIPKILDAEGTICLNYSGTLHIRQPLLK